MTDMLVSLDEKNHVISTATEALNKQLRRIDEIFPYIEREISDEARNGSTTHWAYSENRVAKPAERPRREAPAVAQISREAQLHADEAAARSDARKQAMLAKRGKVAQAESDFDDNRIDARKSHGNTKKTRPAEAISTVGLGITTGMNGAPTAKRRKVEKPNGAPAMERSISGVFPGNGVSKGAAASPREASLPDPVRKKTKAATIPNGQPRKRYERVFLFGYYANFSAQDRSLKCHVSFHCLLPNTQYLPRSESSRSRLSCASEWAARHGESSTELDSVHNRKC
jgi:hypothetical protein